MLAFIDFSPEKMWNSVDFSPEKVYICKKEVFFGKIRYTEVKGVERQSQA